MTPILPADLRDAVAGVIGRFRPAELAAHTGALSRAYRGGSDSRLAIGGDEAAAAYIASRLPATYAAMACALAGVAEHAPEFAPRTILDAGAGPGTASWAAATLWPSVGAITMLDRNPHLLALAGMLCGTSAVAPLREARMIAGDMTALDATQSYDLVLAGYAVAELPASNLETALAALWRNCAGALVIVEPGTPAGFARIRECRARLLAWGARMIAPCPGAYACPGDWCHFAVRLPRSRAHMRAKGASVPFEDEKFSYLAVARETIAAALPSGRIVAEPHVAKPGVTLLVCADGAIAKRHVPRRDRAAYKSAVKAKWGDAV